MVRLPNYYAKEVLKNTGYIPNTSISGRIMQIGDFGIMENGVFEFKGNLLRHKRNFNTKLDISIHKSLPITSKSNGVSKANIKATAVGQGIFDVGIKLTFKKKKGYFLDITTGALSETLNNVDEVAAEIIRLYLVGEWNEDHVVVNEVINGEFTTILISDESNNKVQINGKSKKPIFSFLDIQGNVSASHEKSMVTKIVAKPKVSHLFYGIKLQLSLLNKLLGFDPNVGQVHRFTKSATLNIPLKTKTKNGKIFRASQCFSKIK